MKGYEVVLQIAAQAFLKSKVRFHTLLHITCKSVSQQNETGQDGHSFFEPKFLENFGEFIDMKIWKKKNTTRAKVMYYQNTYHY